MPAIRTMMLPSTATHVSPGGVAEIRLLLQFPAGELTHVLVPSDVISLPAWVGPSSEWFYIMAGHGYLWHRSIDDVIELVPGRCVHIPSGTPFQYRSENTPLEFILAAIPQWRPEYHHILLEGAWTPTAPNRTGQQWERAPGSEHPVTHVDLPQEPAYIAPDGSEMRPLVSEPAGGIAHCVLTPGRVSLPVRHRTVEEIWYVLDGHGEIGRRSGNRDPEITVLRAGVCVDIAVGITFQFRSTGVDSLRLLLLTMPEWPGADEAVVSEELAIFGWPAATS